MSRSPVENGALWLEDIHIHGIYKLWDMIETWILGRTWKLCIFSSTYQLSKFREYLEK